MPYTSPLASAGGVRKIAVAMHFEAFRELGLLYKLRHGFFQDAARQAAQHMPLRVLVPVTTLPFLLLCVVLSADTLASLRVAPFLAAALCFLCDVVFEPRLLAALQRRHGVAPFPKRPFSLKQVFHASVVLPAL